MHVLIGFALGAIASIPATDLVVTVALSLWFAVGSGISGFVLKQIEKAA